MTKRIKVGNSHITDLGGMISFQNVTIKGLDLRGRVGVFQVVGNACLVTGVVKIEKSFVMCYLKYIYPIRFEWTYEFKAKHFYHTGKGDRLIRKRQKSKLNSIVRSMAKTKKYV